MQTVVETDTLRVSHQPGVSDRLWVTFAGRGERRPSAPGLIASLGDSALHVVSKVDDWYQQVPAALFDLARRHDGPRVVFGSSMGGFAALANSAALGADRVIVSGSQVIAAVTAEDQRWSDTRPTRPFVPDARNGLSGTAPIYAFYDPRIREERWHMSLLNSRANLRVCPVRGYGHAVMSHLRESGYWETVLQLCLRGADDDLKALLRGLWKGRRDNYLNLCELGLALAHRGRHRSAERVYPRAIELQPQHHKAWVWLRETRQALGDRLGALEAAKGAAEQVRGRPELWSLYADLENAAYEAGEVLIARAAGAEAESLRRRA